MILDPRTHPHAFQSLIRALAVVAAASPAPAEGRQKAPEPESHLRTAAANSACAACRPTAAEGQGDQARSGSVTAERAPPLRARTRPGTWGGALHTPETS